MKKSLKIFRVRAKKKGQLTVQIDELGSFIKNNNQKPGKWVALEQKTREIICLYIGDRSQKNTQALWDSGLAVYKQCAVCYTDFFDSEQGVLPKKRHRPVAQKSGQPNLIERFNCTLKPRVSRLVRKSLSFSKKLSNHIGAIWSFVHDNNFSLL